MSLEQPQMMMKKSHLHYQKFQKQMLKLNNDHH